MAIRPELGRVSETRMVRSTVGVITNVRPDHLEVMGPTVIEVAEGLARTIPRGGTLFVSQGDFDEQRITVVLVAIGKGQLQCLGDHVDVVRRQVPHRLDIETFQEAQGLAEHGALRPRPTLADGVASVVDGDGLFDGGAVGGEVGPS